MPLTFTLERLIIGPVSYTFLHFLTEDKTAIFFVNQGGTYKEERRGSYLWAPKLNKAGHKNSGYELMKEVHKGDFILNNAGGEIVAISVANEDCKSGEQSRELKDSQSIYEWDNDGWLVTVTYYNFSYPIKTSDLQDWLKANPREDSTFTAVRRPKLQYLWHLNPNHSKYILEKVLKLENNSKVQEVIENTLREVQ